MGLIGDPIIAGNPIIAGLLVSAPCLGCHTIGINLHAQCTMHDIPFSMEGLRKTICPYELHHTVLPRP